MFVPFLTKRVPKGGGAAAGGHASGKASGGKGSSGSPGKYSGKVGGTQRAATAGSKGGGKPTQIPQDKLYSGRYIGGGQREEIYGTRTYGSGYPGYNVAGVGGRNFPFGYLPLVFLLASVGTIIGGEYAQGLQEYGLPESSNRGDFGGTLTIANFTSQAVPGVSYLLYADHDSVKDAIPQVNNNCSKLVVPADLNPVAVSSTSPVSFGPQEVVQYFRSSSAALLLVGYNNTALWMNSTQDSPLPDNHDPNLLACLNATIAERLPITDGDSGMTSKEKEVAIIVGVTLGTVLVLVALLWMCCDFPSRRRRVAYAKVIEFW